MCLSTAAAILLESAKAMAENGWEKNRIICELRTKPFFKQIETLQAENLGHWQQSDLLLFQKNYTIFCLKHKIIGLLKKIAKCALYIPILRRIRNNIRFSCKFEESSKRKI